MDWLRWHHGTVNDPKWRFVAAEAMELLKGEFVKVGEVVSVWACMVEHASQAPNRGTLEGWRDKVYAMLLDIRPETVSAIREAMQGVVLTGESLSGWERRQPRYDATAADRMRRLRSKKEDDPTVTNVTKRNVTIVTTEQSREEQITDGGANAPPAKRESGKRARQLPATWEPSESHREWAGREGIDLTAELEHFRDHHTARGSTMLDWDAAFRTWLRNAKRFSNGKRAVAAPERTRTLAPGEIFQ